LLPVSETLILPCLDLFTETKGSIRGISDEPPDKPQDADYL